MERACPTKKPEQHCSVPQKQEKEKANIMETNSWNCDEGKEPFLRIFNLAGPGKTYWRHVLLSYTPRDVKDDDVMIMMWWWLWRIFNNDQC